MNNYEVVKNKIYERITFIDGIAIVIIVLYHSLAYQKSIQFNIENIGIAGLALFTFSAGIKMGYNHFEELSNKDFLKKYFIKRLIRLYKPYIGYTALIFIPVYFEMYIARNILHFESDSVTTYWNNLNLNGLFMLLIGSNFVSSHLWYLILMIAITFISFTILYYFNIRGLFLSFFPFVILNFSLFNFVPYIIPLVFMYSSIYIFGIFYSSYFYSKLNKTLNLSFSFLFMLFMSISLTRMNFLLMSSNFSLLIYGLLFSCFITFIAPIFSNTKLINSFFILCGNYSFQIYLFHVPLVLHPINILIRYIFGIDSLIIPFLVSIFSICVSILLYQLCKKFHLNVFFE